MVLCLQSIVLNIKLLCFSQSGCHYKQKNHFTFHIITQKCNVYTHTHTHTHTHTLFHTLTHTTHKRACIHDGCTYTQHTCMHTCMDHWYTQSPNKMHRYIYAHPCVYVQRTGHGCAYSRIILKLSLTEGNTTVSSSQHKSPKVVQCMDIHNDAL